MKKIFEEFKTHNFRAKNRLVRSATWENLATPEGGICRNSYNLYDELASGGVGTIITGFTSVDTYDQYLGGMMRLSDDSLIPEYRKLTDIIKKHDVMVITQLALGAYYVKDRDDHYTEVDIDYMSTQEVYDVINKFVEAGRRASEAGFDGVQIHAAHFFFLSRFLSSVVNHRTDEFGGSNAKRAKILVEIMKRIRRVAPQLHITIKINSTDGIPGGLTERDSLEICRILAAEGIDSIEVSGNGTSRPWIKSEADEAYFLPFASRLADEVNVPVILVGGMRSKIVMERVLNNSRIELISLSRPFIRQPNLPKLMEDGETDHADCISCNACYRTDGHTCVFIPKPKWLCDNM